MITASHNPARYNGIKLCREGARPVGEQTGLVRAARDGRGRRPGRTAARRAAITARDLLSGYAAHLKTLVDLSGIRPLKVAVDAGNGMAGHTVPKVFEGLPVEIVPLYFELDGTFPNHEANPIDPKNLVDLQRAVRQLRRGHRPGLRRRRRPVLRGRRAGRDGLAVGADRADRRGRAGPRARRDDHPQPDHLAGRAGDRDRARRQAGADPGRPLVHQGARWPPPARSSAASIPGISTSGTSGSPTPACWRPCTSSPRSGRRTGRCRRCCPSTAGTGPRGRSTARSATSRAPPSGSGHAFAGQDGVTTDDLDGLTVAARRLVVQPAPVEHRAAAQAQRRGAGRANPDRHPRSCPAYRAR